MLKTAIDRSNNFDFLRLFFASLVIVSHSYPLTKQPEIIAEITKGQLSLGSLSVDCFFIMSGYLIMKSTQRSKSPQDYLWKRLLRLYPALIVLIFFTILFLPMVYQGSNIFLERSYQTYFQNALSLYKIQYEVSGVFENNPYPKAINGSLWSLSYEFTLYIALLLLYPIRNFKYLNFIFLGIFSLSFYLTCTETFLLGNTMKNIYLQPVEFYRLCTYFAAGSVLVFIDLTKLNSLRIRFLFFLILVISLYCEIYRYISPIFLPFLILFIGTTKSPFIKNIGKKIGDISYGVYIYAFVIQQILMFYFGLGTFQLMIASTIITYAFAFLSWHLVEKKMLKYKNLIS